MFKKSLFLSFFLVFLLEHQALAAETHFQKVDRLIQAQGLEAMFEVQAQAMRQKTREGAAEFTGHILKSYTLSKPYQKKVEVQYQHYIDQVDHMWSSKRMAELWGSYYGPRFTGEEIDGLIAFYTSALGKKEVVVSREISGNFTHIILAEQSEKIEKAYAVYMKEIKKIIKDCNCAVNSDP